MNVSDPEFLYLVLILPTLFALTLIAEGIHKTLQQQSGVVSIILGFLFLFTVIGAYFFIFT